MQDEGPIYTGEHSSKQLSSFTGLRETRKETLYSLSLIHDLLIDTYSLTRRFFLPIGVPLLLTDGLGTGRHYKKFLTKRFPLSLVFRVRSRFQTCVRVLNMPKRCCAHRPPIPCCFLISIGFSSSRDALCFAQERKGQDLKHILFKRTP